MMDKKWCAMIFKFCRDKKMDSCGLSQCLRDVKSVPYNWKYVSVPKKKNHSCHSTFFPPFSYMELTMAADVGIKWNQVLFSLYTYLQSLIPRLCPRDVSVPHKSDFDFLQRGQQLCRRTVTSCETSSPSTEENSRDSLLTRGSQKKKKKDRKSTHHAGRQHRKP